jgi:hypothetical protein
MVLVLQTPVTRAPSERSYWTAIVPEVPERAVDEDVLPLFPRPTYWRASSPPVEGSGRLIVREVVRLDREAAVHARVGLEHAPVPRVCAECFCRDEVIR